MPTILIPSALRPLAGNRSEVRVAGSTVRGALAALDGAYPGLAAKLFDGHAIKPYLRIFVGADDITDLGGLDAPVSGDDEISIIPAIAGG
ncbi:MAG TPA: MoaD/ThiS family protein [Kofleriaceae bacterium]|jgi:molybdopterin converting factor small subunit